MRAEVIRKKPIVFRAIMTAPLHKACLTGVTIGNMCMAELPGFL